jgi:hypothetical protein
VVSLSGVLGRTVDCVAVVGASGVQTNLVGPADARIGGTLVNICVKINRIEKQTIKIFN